MKKIIIALLMILPVAAIAAGKSKGDHVASVADLKWPAMNFLMLFGFLFFKLKKPISKMFDKNAEDVKELFQVADEKNKEAEIKLNMYQGKVSQIDADCQRILDTSVTEGNTFSKEQESEFNGLVDRLQKDSVNKLEHEKKVLLGQMESTLVDEVISRAKKSISGDKEIQTKATNKMVSQIQ